MYVHIPRMIDIYWSVAYTHIYIQFLTIIIHMSSNIRGAWIILNLCVRQLDFLAHNPICFRKREIVIHQSETGNSPAKKIFNAVSWRTAYRKSWLLQTISQLSNEALPTLWWTKSIMPTSWDRIITISYTKAVWMVYFLYNWLPSLRCSSSMFPWRKSLGKKPLFSVHLLHLHSQSFRLHWKFLRKPSKRGPLL